MAKPNKINFSYKNKCGYHKAKMFKDRPLYKELKAMVKRNKEVGDKYGEETQP